MYFDFFIDDSLLWRAPILSWHSVNPACHRPRVNGEFETKQSTNRRVRIKDVIFADPATVVFWSDGTKTVVKTRGDEKYDKEKGLAMAIVKKLNGNTRDYYEIFQRWCECENE